MAYLPICKLDREDALLLHWGETIVFVFTEDEAKYDPILRKHRIFFSVLLQHVVHQSWNFVASLRLQQ